MLSDMCSSDLLRLLVSSTEKLPLGRHHLGTGVGRALRTEMSDKQVQL